MGSTGCPFIVPMSVRDVSYTWQEGQEQEQGLVGKDVQDPEGGSGVREGKSGMEGRSKGGEEERKSLGGGEG